MKRFRRGVAVIRISQTTVAAILVVVGISVTVQAVSRPPTKASFSPAAGHFRVTSQEVRGASQEVRELLDAYCVSCHNETRRAGGLAFDVLNVQNPAAAPEVWERAIVKLRTRTMPPVGRPRPDDFAYEAAVSWLEDEIDRD